MEGIRISETKACKAIHIESIHVRSARHIRQGKERRIKADKGGIGGEEAVQQVSKRKANENKNNRRLTSTDCKEPGFCQQHPRCLQPSHNRSELQYIRTYHKSLVSYICRITRMDVTACAILN
jgi:hypothetical protein